MEHELLPPPTLAAESSRNRRAAVLLTLWASGLGLVAGLGIGFGVGWLAMESSMRSCSPSDGWCGLGAAIAGMFAGSIAGSIAYVTTGVVLIRRKRTQGRRAALIAAHLALPFGLVTLTTLISGVAAAIG